MKKIIIPAIFLASIIIFVLFAVFISLNQKEEERHERKTSEEERQVISMIKEAYFGNESISCLFEENIIMESCDINFENGNNENPEKTFSPAVIFYQIKEGKIRLLVDYKEDERKESIILKNDIFYIWDDLYAIKIEFNDEDFSSFFHFDFENEEIFAENINRLKIKCKEEEIKDSVFDLPEGVKFITIEEIEETLYEDIEDIFCDVF